MKKLHLVGCGFYCLLAAVSVAGLASPAAAAENAASSSVDVELTVRGPNATPLGGKDVELTATDRHPLGGGQPPHAAAKTDSQGVARFKWPAGVSRMFVRVKGVGYGATGLAEFVPERTARPPLAPLAPFGSIRGRVPKDLLPPAAAGNGQGVVVRLRADRSFDEPINISCEADGAFSADDVPAGVWYAEARTAVPEGSKEAGRRLTAGARVAVGPGERVERVELPPLPKEQAADPGTHTTMRRGSLDGQKTSVWAAGTVRDDAGRPVAGADVYAVGTYHGGIRMEERIEKATSGADGRYEIKGEAGLSMFTATLVAHRERMVPAFARVRGDPAADEWVEVDAPPTSSPATRPLTRPATRPAATDFTLTARGGGLDVTVLRDGKPASDVSVGIWQDGADLRDTWARGGSPDLRTAIEDFLYPVATTDAAGVAHFPLLRPGRYQVIAAEGKVLQRKPDGTPIGEPDGKDAVRRLRQPWPGQDEDRAYAVRTGVGVRAGETAAFSLAISPQSTAVRFRVLKSDGQPLAGDHLPFDWSSVKTGGGWSSGITLGADGVGTHAFEDLGLWRVEVRFRESPVKSVPLRDAPFDAAGGFVAVSPSLAGAPPATFTARHYEAGAVVAEVVDGVGKPMRAVVEVGQSVGEPTIWGTTDERGMVRFDGVPKWKYLVRARLLGEHPVDLGEWRTPFPSDAALRRADRFIPLEPADVSENTVRRVRLRPVPGGYVRGTLTPPAGHKTGEYEVYLTDSADAGAQVHYNPFTGELLAGPFRPGTTVLRIVGNTPAGGQGDVARQEVKVKAGEVAPIDLSPPAPPHSPAPGDHSGGQALIGMGGIRYQSGGAEALAGRVLLPDGKTPAFGAVVLYFPPHAYQPALAGMTEADGAIRARGLWQSGNAGDGKQPEPPGGPAGPAIVAMLPGSHGATVVDAPEPGKPLSIVLPPAASAAGRVTIGGKAASGQKGTIRILAAYEGRGTLNGAFGVGTTARADGSFEVAGLTPGTYRVQAALDDVWLSPSVQLRVDAGGAIRPAGPLVLDVGAPGGSAAVKLVDAGGNPLKGREVTVDRPPGPLADALWPRAFMTDGAGVALIPTLEAGKHTIRTAATDGAAATVQQVEAAANPAAGPAEVRVVVK